MCGCATVSGSSCLALNESPSEKEGKCEVFPSSSLHLYSLNESPSEKEGKFRVVQNQLLQARLTLNESPSEKEGK